MLVYHYKAGFVKYRHLTDPYFYRPSLNRYKDDSQPASRLETTEGVYSSTIDPNIASRLNRR